ncbi:MAG: glycerol kinase GlpK [Candidatus Hydrogenedentota bacterium]
MTCVIALDQGTTSSRAIVFDRKGQALAITQEEFTQHFPRFGWVEHDPRKLWESQWQVTLAAYDSCGLHKASVAAVGITNQRETTLVWDRSTGQPIYPAIVWQDRRTADICERLGSEGTKPLFREKTGLVLDPYFSGTKIKWLLDNVDGARERAERGELVFGTVDTWLVWRLTKGARHVTDISNASRTLLFNIHTGTWDDELLQLLNVPRELLPEVRSSSEVYGEVALEGPLKGAPIAGIAGDQQAALFGQMCFSPGMAKNTYGTGCFILKHTGTEAVTSKNNLLTTVAWRIGDQIEYALEGSIFVGGAVVQWLRDALRVIKTAPEVEALARRVPDAGGVYFVPAFAGLGAPHWDPYARGTITGMTRGTTAAHIARAALDSIALQSVDVLKAMEQDSGIPLQELKVDGGACMDDLLMQIQADLLQAPVLRPKFTETTALGAAYLAGLATGFWRDRGEIERQWRLDCRFEPSCSPEQAEQLRRGWRRAVERARGWEETSSDETTP